MYTNSEGSASLLIDRVIYTSTITINKYHCNGLSTIIETDHKYLNVSRHQYIIKTTKIKRTCNV